MPATTYRDFVKVNNAALRLQPAIIQAQQLAVLNSFQQRLTWYGDDPALWDYPSGTVVVNASTSNARSTVFDYGRDGFHKGALVRVTTTIGATPTATYAIQGSNDGSSWSAVNYADYLTPSTIVATTFTITTATTVIKVVQTNQSFRYLSVNVTSDTNVTNTIDITLLG